MRTYCIFNNLYETLYVVLYNFVKLSEIKCFQHLGLEFNAFNLVSNHVVAITANLVKQYGKLWCVERPKHIQMIRQIFKPNAYQNARNKKNNNKEFTYFQWPLHLPVSQLKCTLGSTIVQTKIMLQRKIVDNIWFHQNNKRI